MEKEQQGNAKKRFKKNEEGFTLVEIIAVLVILGILAAVAIPKYFDMQSEARKRAAQGAIAEVAGRINQKFGKALLTGSLADQIDYNVDSVTGGLGDFDVELDGNAGPATGGSITITVTGNTPALNSVTAIRIIPRPRAL